MTELCKRNRKTVDYNLLNSHGRNADHIEHDNDLSGPDIAESLDDNGDDWELQKHVDFVLNQPDVLSTKNTNSTNKIARLSTSKVRRKRQDFSMGQKLHALELLKTGRSQTDIARQLGVAQPSLSRMFVQRKEIIAEAQITYPERRRRRFSKYADIEKRLDQWKLTSNNFSVSHSAIKEKAKQISLDLGYVGFKPSSGFVSRWKKKRNLLNSQDKQKCTYIPPLLKEEPDATNPLPDHVVSNLLQYHPDDIYTCSEFALHHRAMPNTFDNLISGGPQLAVLLSCNQSGSDKRKLLVVGSEGYDRFLASRPCTYKMNTQSWISSDIFKEWLMNFDSDMVKENRKVVLVLCEAPIHSSDMQFSLSNTKLKFLSTSAVLLNQPCGTGLGRILKYYYRKELVERTLLTGNNYTPSLLDILHMLNKAWLCIGSHTVKCCYWMAGFKPEIVDPLVTMDDIVSISTLTVKESDKFVDHDVGLQSHSMSSCNGDNLESKDSGEKCSTMDLDFAEGNVILREDIITSLSTIRQYMDSNRVQDFSTFYSLESQLTAHINDTQ